MKEIANKPTSQSPFPLIRDLSVAVEELPHEMAYYERKAGEITEAETKARTGRIWRHDPVAGPTNIWYTYQFLNTPELPVTPLPSINLQTPTFTIQPTEI